MKQEMYYTAYGLQIESQLALPELLPSTVRTTDVAIRYGAVPSSLDNPTGQGIVYQAKPGQLLLTLDGIANYLVSDGTEITIARAPGSRDDDVRLFLLGSAFGALLHQRSVLPLHGSAVATPHGAAVFVGHSGYGKSTLAAAMHQRGYRVLSDDVCVIDLHSGKPIVYPAYPRLHLWADVLDKLHGELPRHRVRRNLEKYGVSVEAQFATQSMPLYAIYELELINTPDVALQSLEDMKKFRVLVTHTYRAQFLDGLGLRARHFSQVIAAATPTKVSRLSRPEKPFMLDALVELLEQDFLAVEPASVGV